MNGGRSEERPASLAVRMDKGPRGTQQDHIAACKVYSGGSREITLVVQLDGMGGYAGGDVAAQIAGGHCLGKAVLALSGVGSPPVESTEWETFCADCVKAANEAVVREKAVNQGLSEAGSTIVFAAVVNRNVHLAWLGDSRAYIYRGGTMEKLTHDHSRTQELIDRRELSPDDREDHPDAGCLTKWLGTPDCFEPDTATADGNGADLLLTCSDGLHGCLSDDCLGALIADHMASVGFNPGLLAQQLVDAALYVGGQDNVSVAVLSLLGSVLPPTKRYEFAVASSSVHVSGLGRPSTEEDRHV